AVESPEGLAPTERPVTVKRRADAAASAGSADPGASDAVDVAVTLSSGVAVTIEPYGSDVHLEGPYTFRIRDERGIAVHDGHRGDCMTSVSGSGGIPFRLAPGNYVVEVHCPNFVTGTARFAATHDAKITVEMVPLEGGADGR